MFRKLAAVALTVASVVALSAPARAAGPDFCADYARSAVHEFEVAAHTPGCLHDANARWTPNYNQHFNWCLNVSREQAWSEREIRRHRLHECQARIDY